MKEALTYGFQGPINPEKLMEVVDRTPPNISNLAFIKELGKVSGVKQEESLSPQVNRSPRGEQQIAWQTAKVARRVKYLSLSRSY